MHPVEILVSGILVLEFDGSFRPPKDPGYPTLPLKLATCASCLYSSFDDDTSRRPLAVGSRLLAVSVDMTSGHAEYEGLLLGLEWLSRETSLVTGENCKQQLLVQGDCKTVIDQLLGTSVPRKLQSQHMKAMDYIDEIGQHFAKIEFQHIPRNENSICDNLCANTMVAAASSCWNSCLADIENSEDLLIDIVARYCQSNSSWIRYSIRPPLYSKLFQIAQARDDYKTMVAVGELLFAEARRYRNQNNSAALMARGVLYQICGMHGLGLERKASALERKHRILLRPFQIYKKDGMYMPLSTELQSTGSPAVSWDAHIPESWSSLLGAYWAQAKSLESWEEGSTIWVGEQDSCIV
eukprot:scaffold10671_cov131-Cylindrotheca_fusiformis.AAC.5